MEDFSNHCRVCLKPENAQKLLRLFDQNAEIVERIFFVSGVDVSIKLFLIAEKFL